MAVVGPSVFYESLRAILNRIPAGEELRTIDIIASMELAAERHRHFMTALKYIVRDNPGICERRAETIERYGKTIEINRYVWSHRPLDWHAGLTPREEAAPAKSATMLRLEALEARVTALEGRWCHAYACICPALRSGSEGDKCSVCPN